MFTEKERKIILRLLDAAICNTVFYRRIAPTVPNEDIDAIFSISEKLYAPITRETDIRKTVALVMKREGKKLGVAPKVHCRDCGLDFKTMARYEEAFEDNGDIVCADCLLKRHDMEKDDVDFWKGEAVND